MDQSDAIQEKLTAEPLADHRLLVLLMGLVATIFLVALPEQLSVAEAQLLVRVLDGDSPDRASSIQNFWSYIVGTMERPARLLGVLSAALVLLLGLVTSRGLPRSSRFMVLLALAGSGLFWRSALQIGAESWPLLVGALVLLILRMAQWSPGWAALGGALGSAILGLAIPEEAAQLHDLKDFAAQFGVASPWTSLSLWLTAALLLAFLVLSRRGAAFVLALFAVGLGPIGVAALCELEAGQLKIAMLSLIPALALGLGVASRQVAGRAPIFIGILGILVLIGVAEPIKQRCFGGHEDRARLDQATPFLPPAGWMGLFGERAPVLRYYERVGHRGPGRSLLIANDQEAQAFVDRVLLEQPPVVLLFDAPEALTKPLMSRYDEAKSVNLPAGLTLLAFRRR